MIANEIVVRVMDGPSPHSTLTPCPSLLLLALLGALREGGGHIDDQAVL